MKPKTPPGRFLAPRAGNGQGYVNKPLRQVPSLGVHDDDRRREVEHVATHTDIRDEPEAISGAWLEDWAEVSALHRSQQHAIDVAVAQQLRPQLAAEDRLKDIHRRAKHGHVDLSHEIHIMRRDLDRARSRDQPPPSRTLERLGRIESLLDGIAA